MGSDLYRTFVEAGLPPPHMHKDAAIGGGPDWAGYDYLSEMSSAAKTLAQRVGQSSTDRGWWSMCAKRWLRRTACSACRVRSTRGPDLSPHNVARCVWRLAHVEPRVCHRVAPDGLYARK